MAQNLLNRLLWALALVALQVLVFNHVHLWGYATPVVYVYVLCLFSLETSRGEWLLWGFFVGLFADMFTATPGLGAASLTFTALCAPGLLRLFTPKDGVEGLAPTYRTLGRWKYVGYVTSLVLCHQAAMVLFEFFSFFNPLDMLVTYLGSSALTLVLVLVLGRLQGKKGRDTAHGG